MFPTIPMAWTPLTQSYNMYETTNEEVQAIPSAWYYLYPIVFFILSIL